MSRSHSRNPLPAHIPRKFQRIHIELTNRCNFSCLFCPDGRMTRPRGNMDEDLARSTLDRIAELDLAEKVTFHVMGEPLMHPGFFRILDHAAALGLPVGLTTNGALLGGDRIRALAERDLHQIDISLQSPDAESFAATRGTRMDFEAYRDRLLDLLEACSERPDPPIFKIRIMTTRFAGRMRKELGIPDFLGSAEALRKTVRQWAGLVYDRLNMDSSHRERMLSKVDRIGIRAWNVIEIAPKIFMETYLLTDWGNAFANGEVIEAGHGYCFGMRDHFGILWTGDVVLCCIDFDGRTSVGNLRERSLEEILAGPDLERIMEGFARGRLVHPHCRRCLGSTTRVGAWFKPALSFLGLKVLKPFFYRRYRLFE